MRSRAVSSIGWRRRAKSRRWSAPAGASAARRCSPSSAPTRRSAPPTIACPSAHRDPRGASGCGKTMLLRQLVHDMLDADGWALHRNLDRVHATWLVRGSRIIAGMSYLGQWEQRCVDLLEACQERRAVLWVDDLHAWGRI